MCFQKDFDEDIDEPSEVSTGGKKGKRKSDHLDFAGSFGEPNIVKNTLFSLHNVHYSLVIYDWLMIFAIHPRILGHLLLFRMFLLIKKIDVSERKLKLRFKYKRKHGQL